MAEIIPFRKPKASERHANKALCRSGFHKWKAEPHRPFDVKQGKLVTVYRCQRCGITRTELS